jgi:hypothetical protein
MFSYGKLSSSQAKVSGLFLSKGIVDEVSRRPKAVRAVVAVRLCYILADEIGEDGVRTEYLYCRCTISA